MPFQPNDIVDLRQLTECPIPQKILGKATIIRQWVNHPEFWTVLPYSTGETTVVHQDHMHIVQFAEV